MILRFERLYYRAWQYVFVRINEPEYAERMTRYDPPFMTVLLAATLWALWFFYQGITYMVFS